MTQISYLVIILVVCLSANCNFLESISAKNSLRFLITPTAANTSILGSAANYAVLAGSTTTNAGITKVTGSVGVSPSTSIAGTQITIVDGETHAGDANSLAAQADLTTAYNSLANMTGATDMTGKELGGLTLVPGTYKFTTECALSNGILTLDAKGDSTAKWVFQIGTTLITGVNSQVIMANSGLALNAYWQVGSSATFKDSTIMKGNIIAYSSIAFGNLSTLEGRALARSGAVTMLSNTIDASSVGTTTSGTTTGGTTSGGTTTGGTTTGGTTTTSSNFITCKWIITFVFVLAMLIV